MFLKDILIYVHICFFGQSNEVGGSYHMEKEGLKRSLALFDESGALSPHHQTSFLEAFHSVILHFAPKNIDFPFLEMLCR